MPVEPERRFVLCVDNQRKDRGIGARRTMRRIEDQRTAQASAFEPAIDGQTADQPTGQVPGAGQTLGDVRRQIKERKAGGRKG